MGDEENEASNQDKNYDFVTRIKSHVSSIRLSVVLVFEGFAMKRLMVALLCSLFFTSVTFAATQTVNGVTWDYVVSNGTAKIYDIMATSSSPNAAISSSTVGAITIPSTLGGYPVTSIGNYAFYGCRGLTSVTIPSNVTLIASHAFSGCSGLMGNLIIPEGVETIEDNAFFGCYNLTSVTIPLSVKSIGNDAFCEVAPKILKMANCWPNGISISELKEVVILDGVTSISRCMFAGFEDLMSITIPSSVISIEELAFYYCDNLKQVHIDDLEAWLRIRFLGSYSNPLVNSSIEGLYLKGEKLTSVTIPEGITSINHSAFENCRSLISVDIPESVTEIGSSAFEGCSSLTSVTIPEGVTSIGYAAFRGCGGLTSVTIPNSVTEIGEYAFESCSSLASIICFGRPPSGWKNASVSSSVIIHYPQKYFKLWDSLHSSSQRGVFTEAISFADVSVLAEMTTPKTMKVNYTIHSDARDKAKVYALAFEDGERSFAKVVPVKTVAADSPEAVPNGHEVTTNAEHTFIWNVPADWDTDLSKVMVEILVQEGELLPLELITIPGDATTPTMTITRNALPQNELFNALLWCYASGDTSLTNTNGVLKVNGTQIANGSSLSSTGAQATALLNYLYGKMGYKVLSGANLSYAEEITELDFSSSGLTQVAVKVATSSVSEE